MMTELKLNLTVDEINHILNVLSKEPYNNVFLLIQKIQTQSNEQIK